MFKRDVINPFCKASSMEVSATKSCFMSTSMELNDCVLDIFPYKVNLVEEDFVYLGFNLKPNGYGKNDWKWLLNRVDKRIGVWCYRWLSLGGRLTLAKVVLESIHVYWLSLFKLPMSILEELRKKTVAFIWSGKLANNKYHLACWESLYQFLGRMGGGDSRTWSYLVRI